MRWNFRTTIDTATIDSRGLKIDGNQGTPSNWGSDWMDVDLGSAPVVGAPWTVTGSLVLIQTIPLSTWADQSGTVGP